MSRLRHLAFLALLSVACGSPRSAEAPPSEARPPADLPDLDAVVKSAKALAVQDTDGRYWAFETNGVLEAVEGTLTLAEGTLVATSQGSDDGEAIADRLLGSLAGGGSFSITTDAQGKLVGTATTQETEGNVVIRVSRVLRPRPCASNADCKDGLECQRKACVRSVQPVQPVPGEQAAQGEQPVQPVQGEQPVQKQ